MPQWQFDYPNEANGRYVVMFILHFIGIVEL